MPFTFRIDKEPCVKDQSGGTVIISISARVDKMITREQLRAELDEVEDKDLDILHRIIMALASSPCSSEPVTEPLHETPEWHRFIEDTYVVSPMIRLRGATKDALKCARPLNEVLARYERLYQILKRQV